jgi:hypothetical protein
MALLMLIEEPPLSLGESDLAKQFLWRVTDRMQRGKLLKQALLQAIDDLRPAVAVPKDDPRMRPYLIYRGEYIEGRSRSAVQAELAVCATTYTKAKQRGMNWIMAYLPYAVRDVQRRTV